MLTLIPFTSEHFPILSAYFSNAREVVQWGGPAVFYPLDPCQLQHMLDESAATPPTRNCWMAAKSGHVIGHVQLVFDWPNGNARLSRVVIDPQVRGRGHAEPMLCLVLAQAFEHPEIQRLELNVYSWNTPAIRIYERLGFMKEGSCRSSAAADGERWDTIQMGMLRSEWHPEQNASRR